MGKGLLECGKEISATLEISFETEQPKGILLTILTSEVVKDHNIVFQKCLLKYPPLLRIFSNMSVKMSFNSLSGDKILIIKKHPPYEGCIHDRMLIVPWHSFNLVN